MATGSFSLLDHPWLPVRRADGRVDRIRPDQLTDFTGGAHAPVVALAAPRPDFNGALLEFLIGLVSTACPPADGEAWDEGWQSPPSPETLRAAFSAHARALVLDGAGPRFLQDEAALSGDETGVEALLIDAPGQQTRSRNTDLFVHRDRVARLSRPAAAWALLTLQTYAPGGGAGHMTSLRGGGPLTTVVLPPADPPGSATLWHLIWLNAESRPDCEERRPSGAPADPAAIFPWLGPTRVSGKQGRRTTQAEVDPRHVWFAMPRRIRLAFRAAEPGEACDLTGEADPVMVAGYVTRPYGFQYGEGGFRHPLSPYYRPKPGADWLPVHGGPSGIGYRDWLALTLESGESGEATRRCAAGVSAARARLAGLGGYDGVRLRAFGYDMDNMKARGWVEAEMPLLLSPDEDTRDRLHGTAAALVAAAQIIARATVDAIKEALFPNPKKNARGDFGHLEARFWRATESAFFAALTAAAGQGRETEEAYLVPRRGFLRALRAAAAALFDELAPVEGLELAEFRRVVSARSWLTGHFVPELKDGRKVVEALGLPPPEKPKARPSAKRRPAKT